MITRILFLCLTVTLFAACDIERSYSVSYADKEGRSVGASVTLKPAVTGFAKL